MSVERVHELPGCGVADLGRAVRVDGERRDDAAAVRAEAEAGRGDAEVPPPGPRDSATIIPPAVKAVKRRRLSLQGQQRLPVTPAFEAHHTAEAKNFGNVAQKLSQFVHQDAATSGSPL